MPRPHLRRRLATGALALATTAATLTRSQIWGCFGGANQVWRLPA
ncbi:MULTISPECIES: hypothetical protein [unclassified Micromonospora]|nr:MULTISPECIES: hypothetical protein [unclassified Micromonospora]MDM4779369.1 hypothetical protein [Micromonospora sp. b486]